jgi:hypothetical protein
LRNFAIILSNENWEARILGQLRHHEFQNASGVPEDIFGTQITSFGCKPRAIRRAQKGEILSVVMGTFSGEEARTVAAWDL